MRSLLVSDFIIITIDVVGMVAMKDAGAGGVDMEVREVGVVHTLLDKTLDPGTFLRQTTKSHGLHFRQIPRKQVRHDEVRFCLIRWDQAGEESKN